MAFLLSMASVTHASDLSLTIKNENEAKTIIRLLKYVRGLERKSSGTKIGVIFSNRIDKSKGAALETKEIIDKAKAASSNKLNIEVVSLELLEESDHNFDIILVNGALYPEYLSVRNISKKNKVLSISLDPECAKQQACAISIQVKNNIKIFLNEKTLSNSGYDVDAAFRFMATRL